jgi:hypothetical protein
MNKSYHIDPGKNNSITRMEAGSNQDWFSYLSPNLNLSLSFLFENIEGEI